MTQNEIWKSVVGYEGYYEVSNLGRVKSIARNIVYKKGKPHPKKERIMHPVHRKDGYMDLCLYKNTINQRFMVHYLVARAFLGEPKDKKEVNHKNGIREDNRAENLEWVTHSENNLHCYNVLNRKPSCLGKFGKDHPASKPVVRIDNITNEKNVFESLTDASVKNSISLKSISACCSGRQKTAGGYKWEFQKELC